MNSSFLYHAWGLYSLECTREEYKGNTIILHVQSKKPQKKGGCIIMGNAPSLSSAGRYHLNFHSSNVILFPFRTKQRSIVPVIFF